MPDHPRQRCSAKRHCTLRSVLFARTHRCVHQLGISAQYAPHGYLLCSQVTKPSGGGWPITYPKRHGRSGPSGARIKTMDVRLIILVTLLVLSACAPGQQTPLPQAAPHQQAEPQQPAWSPPTPKALSNMLEQGMAQSQVREVGGPPTSSSMGSCGGAYGRPWSCLTWTYDNTLERSQTRAALKDAGILSVTFEKIRGQWVVNSWR